MSEAQVSKHDVERLFLQAVLSRGLVSRTVAQLLYKKCINAVNLCGALQIKYDGGDAPWNAFESSISNSLNKLELEFRSTEDENTGGMFYAIINRKDDEIAQLATDYTPTEISFFKGVEQIMLAPHESFSVSSLAALREISALKLNMTKAQGETLLTSFVAKGWLTKSKRGRYALAVRSTLELPRYLKSTYPDEYLECTVCLNVLTRGISCHTRNCQVRLHHHCYNKYSRKNHHCPTCKVAWSEDVAELVHVGEEATRDLEDNRRRTRRTTEDSDEEAELSGENDEAPSQGKTQSKAKSKGKGRQKQKQRATTVSDDDVDMDEKDNEPSQQPRRSRRH